MRHILENLVTTCTPHQAEISQGHMEALVNFQTMVCDLTGMPIAQALMLDEAAAAQAMALALRCSKSKSTVFYVDDQTLPQTREIIEARAPTLGIEVRTCTGPEALQGGSFAVFLQYPGSGGELRDLQAWVKQYKAQGGIVIFATDLLALTLLKPPGEMGADIVVGTTQRLGMPMSAVAPHAAFMACKNDFKPRLRGHLVAVSVDAQGKAVYRLAQQTREQHIRHKNITASICAAHVLPAVVDSMYAVYHGPKGLTRTARRIASDTAILAAGLKTLGVSLLHDTAFDTLTLDMGSAELAQTLHAKVVAQGLHLRCHIGSQAHLVGISLDETSTRENITVLWSLLAQDEQRMPAYENLEPDIEPLIPKTLRRTSVFLTHPVFNLHHSKTGMLRYIRHLCGKAQAQAQPSTRTQTGLESQTSHRESLPPSFTGQSSAEGATTPETLR